MEQENSISRKYQILLMINQAVFHRFRGEREITHFVFHFMSCLHSQLPPCCTVVFVLQIRFTSNLELVKCKVDIEVDI